MAETSEDFEMTRNAPWMADVKDALSETHNIQRHSACEIYTSQSTHATNIRRKSYIYSSIIRNVHHKAEDLLEKYVSEKPSCTKAESIQNISSIEDVLGQLPQNMLKRLLQRYDLHRCCHSLQYAARYNDILGAQMLLNGGADPNVINEKGQTPLHFAAQNITDNQSKYWGTLCSGEYNTVIYHLVSSGANINAQDVYGRTPLHYAVIKGNAFTTRELLKSSNINTEIFDEKNLTPLHYAAMRDRTEIVALLLEANANPEVFDKELSTPLMIALKNGNKEIVLLLLESYEKQNDVEKLKQYMDMEDGSGEFALHTAIYKGYFEVVKILLQKGASPSSKSERFSKSGQEPLHFAAACGNAEIGKCLLEYGADVNCIDMFNNKPLHKAAEFNSAEVVDILLEKGGRIEARNDFGFTPLMTAAANGHVDVVIKLAEAGARVDASWRGRNSLHLAARRNHSTVLSILLKYNASFEIADDLFRRTPLHSAALKGHIDCVQVFIKYHAYIIESSDMRLRTALHYAVRNGSHEVTNVLLNVGANADAKDSSYMTPLHEAAKRGWKQCCQMLLDANCKVDPLNRLEETPLHLAVKFDHKDVVKLLLKTGADCFLSNSEGQSPMDMAIIFGLKDVVLEIFSHARISKYLERKFWHWIQGEANFRNTPFRNMIRFLPDLAEHVLDHCIEEDLSKFINYNYEYIDDTFGLSYPYKCDILDSMEEHDSFSHPVYNFDGSVKKCVPRYHENREFWIHNHPLMIMVEYGRENLLSHPLCEKLIMYKWRKYGYYAYFGQLCIYLFFVALLTSYAFSSIPPCPDSKADSECCSGRNVTCQPYIGKCNDSLNQDHLKKYQKSIYFFVLLLMLKEVYQMYQNRLEYLNIKNILECSCYISTLIFVVDLTECSSQTGIRKVWQWELGSLSIFLAWMVLLMFISKFPFLGIYVVMFKQILIRFLKTLIPFVLFVVAFAISFFLVLKNQDSFKSIGESIMKMSVMMIGEIEFNEIFNKSGNKVYFQAAYFFLIIFILFVAVILMNMLIGLAVHDIKDLQGKAAINRLGKQVKLLLSVESVLPTFLLRKCITKYSTEENTSSSGLLDGIRKRSRKPLNKSVQKLTKALLKERMRTKMLMEKFLMIPSRRGNGERKAIDFRSHMEYHDYLRKIHLDEEVSDDSSASDMEDYVL